MATISTSAPSQRPPPKRRPPYCGPVIFGFPLRCDQEIEYTKRFMVLTDTPIAHGQSKTASGIDIGCGAAWNLSKRCAQICPDVYLTESRRGLHMIALVRSTRMDNTLLPQGEQLEALKQFMVSEGFVEGPGWFRDS